MRYDPEGRKYSPRTQKMLLSRQIIIFYRIVFRRQVWLEDDTLFKCNSVWSSERYSFVGYTFTFFPKFSFSILVRPKRKDNFLVIRETRMKRVLKVLRSRWLKGLSINDVTHALTTYFFTMLILIWFYFEHYTTKRGSLMTSHILYILLSLWNTVNNKP